MVVKYCTSVIDFNGSNQVKSRETSPRVDNLYPAWSVNFHWKTNLFADAYSSKILLKNSPTNILDWDVKVANLYPDEWFQWLQTAH